MPVSLYRQFGMPPRPNGLADIPRDKGGAVTAREVDASKELKQKTGIHLEKRRTCMKYTLALTTSSLLVLSGPVIAVQPSTSTTTQILTSTAAPNHDSSDSLTEEHNALMNYKKTVAKTGQASGPSRQAWKRVVEVYQKHGDTPPTPPIEGSPR